MKPKDNKFLFEMYSRTADGWLVTPRFRKKDMEILEITDGVVNVQIGTEYIEAKAGNFLYIPAGLMYSVASCNGVASVRALVFDKSIIESDMVNYETELLYMFYIQSENKIRVFGADHPISPILERCMMEAYDEYLVKDVCYKLPIRANIYLIMSALLRFYCGTKNELDKLVYHNVMRLKPVISYIGDNYSEKLRIETLSEKIMVSPDYFTKMFKDSIGKTPIDYINGIRINKAMQLLVESDLSMSEISDAIGFCNANYFHKIFKQYMNVSPLAYRKCGKVKNQSATK